MRRKLVKQGPSTLTVSVPSSWVKSNRLLPGSDVQVRIEENIVQISANPQPEKRLPVTLHVKQFSQELTADIIQSLYKKGIDEIRLYCTAEQVVSVEQLLRRSLLGYEIVEQKTDHVTIRFIASTKPEEIMNIIKRLFLVILSLAEGFANAKSDETELLILEETSDRLASYCETILLRHVLSEKNVIFKHQLVTVLERVGDEYRRLLEEGVRDSASAKKCHHILLLSYDVLFSYSREKHDAFLRSLRACRASLEKEKSPIISIVWVLHQLKEPLAGLHI